MEALVFILIGLSLRGVIVRLGGLGDALVVFAPAVAAVLAAVLVSRFVWVFSVEALNGALCKFLRRRSAAPDWRSATVTSWAGMRGVVTLAIALSLPDSMPCRDLILVAAFAAILVTVLGQGTTIGPLIRCIQPAHAPDTEDPLLTEPQAWARLTEAHQLEAAYPAEERAAHYNVVLAAIAAGRTELLRMHRSGQIDDKLLTLLNTISTFRRSLHSMDTDDLARHATVSPRRSRKSSPLMQRPMQMAAQRT
jgi:hypothetical protein